jgi:hypothetical protein
MDAQQVVCKAGNKQQQLSQGSGQSQTHEEQLCEVSHGDDATCDTIVISAKAVQGGATRQVCKE